MAHPVRVIGKRGLVRQDNFRRLDSVKQNGRFTDNHFGRSTGLIVGGYSAMFVAPSL